ncbi:MAG: ABC transporter ATP-binding protein [Planctomycetia bacterium]|nr:ABC transporter ATP-binding protein [Planctomycetia bacterium]
MNTILKIENLDKSYFRGRLETPVLHGINLSMERGEYIAVMGPSGCGKSTLLYSAGLLARPTRGTVSIDGVNSEKLSDAGRTRLRRKHIGFVFQQFNLLPALSAYNNVRIALRLRGEESHDGASEALRQVGLYDKRHRRPGALSVGEQQRVAIARGLVTRPAILLVDEPTGCLDSENARNVLELIQDFNRNLKQTILLVTHSAEVASRADRIVRMKDGRIINSCG